MKKGGASLLGRKEWQRRYVVFTGKSEIRRLAYYKSEAVSARAESRRLFIAQRLHRFEATSPERRQEAAEEADHER